MIRLTKHSGVPIVVNEADIVSAYEEEWTDDVGGKKKSVVRITLRNGREEAVLDPDRTVLARLAGELPRVRLDPPADRPTPASLLGPKKTVAVSFADRGSAIWDHATVYKLNAYQHDHTCHPYTCGTDSTHRPLVATLWGFVCPDCGYTQGWYQAPPAPKGDA